MSQGGPSVELEAGQPVRQGSCSKRRCRRGGRRPLTRTRPRRRQKRKRQLPPLRVRCVQDDEDGSRFAARNLRRRARARLEARRRGRSTAEDSSFGYAGQCSIRRDTKHPGSARGRKAPGVFVYGHQTVRACLKAAASMTVAMWGKYLSISAACNSGSRSAQQSPTTTRR
jgi:hypothetical protein